MTRQLERGAKEVIQTLLEHGYEAYMVGGCVRDMQLNRPVKDYDIATSAKPEQVQRLFRRTVPTGLQHGTVSVIIKDNLYEVTTFRKESEYEDFRRPAEVQYIDSLYEDLRRRDFTMNAMALDIHYKLIDPFEGVRDLQNRLLRCVGDANERFQEDALRMLRCIRFAAQFGLTIERQTWLALLQQAPLLSHIAMERVRMELERMIGGADPAQAVQLLIDSQILGFVKQPLKLAALTTEALSGHWSSLSEPLTKLAYLYLRVGIQPDDVGRELRQLTFSKQQLEHVRPIISASYQLGRMLADGADTAVLERAWKVTAVAYGTAACEAVLNIIEADPKALAELGVSDSLSVSLAENGFAWLKDMPVQSLVELKTNGKELLAHIGRPAGPWVARVLSHLLTEAALKNLSNEKEALLSEACRYYERIQSQESGAYEHK